VSLLEGSTGVDIDDSRYLARGIDNCQYVQVNEFCCPPVLDGALGEDAAADLAGLFKVLGDPARLRLLSLIAAAPGGACTCELVEPLGRSQPTVSHHLKALREAGLIEGERVGTWVWYRVVPERLEALRGALAPAQAPVASAEVAPAG
jgi:ArsR family transcriptional regulator, arsenate/arsenite/antimonite-responsive transcriptional repressor